MARTARHAPLTREAVIAAGLALGDAEGLDAVSFRRLASELDVTPMALYRYVDNKEALLTGMLHAVWEDVALPEPGADWREGLTHLAGSLRDAFLAHPVAATIAATRPESGPPVLRVIEGTLALLEQAGFTVAEATRIYVPFARALLALVLFEASLLPELPDAERITRARRTLVELEALPAERYPHVVAAAPLLAVPYDPRGVFDRGLDLLQAGIEAQLPARRGRRTPG
jgi:AcrR family transcriptional regulator